VREAAPLFGAGGFVMMTVEPRKPRLTLIKATPRLRLIKAGTPEWHALNEVPKTCPKCGQDRVLPGPAYDRSQWRCYACGVTPKKPKPKKK
jgi:ribosomal protein S27AE